MLRHALDAIFCTLMFAPGVLCRCGQPHDPNRTPDAPAVTYKTLRDEIAIAAMVELLRMVTDADESLLLLAPASYVLADQMLAAREAK